MNMTTNIERFWEIEEIDSNTNLREDKIYMEKYTEPTKKDRNGRSVVKLLFKK